MCQTTAPNGYRAFPEAFKPRPNLPNLPVRSFFEVARYLPSGQRPNAYLTKFEGNGKTPLSRERCTDIAAGHCERGRGAHVDVIARGDKFAYTAGARYDEGRA
jgi:hypothetical protein